MRNVLFVPLAVGVALMASGCNPTASENSSAVFLQVSFEGQTNAEGFIGIASDVVSDSGTTTDDLFNLHVRSIAKSPTANIQNGFYRVEFEGVSMFYTRTDGRNEPGVDVPFPLNYAVGGSVDAGGEADLNLIVVTSEMKLQPPLRNLWFGEGQRVFATINLRLFGHDLVRNSVSGDASAVVVFGDFAG